MCKGRIDEGTRDRLTMVKRRSTDDERDDDGSAVVAIRKHRRITRSISRKVLAKATTTSMFESVSEQVLASGYLHWYEAENLGCVSKSCRLAWMEQKETYGGWSCLLRELNMMNCTNRCSNCEYGILNRKSNRQFCNLDQWNVVSSKRTPDFHGVVDLIVSCGVLNWREKGGIRRISKTCYKVHKEQCCCNREPRSRFVTPFIKYDPRFDLDYENLSDYQKCVAMTKYTSWMVQNLSLSYNFKATTDESQLPLPFQGWNWFDAQLISLQQHCPRRYAFVMNIVSLFLAQNELQRSPPKWFVTAFLGERFDRITHEEGGPDPPAFYETLLGATISENCLPATDEFLGHFLQHKCYPTISHQTTLGPKLTKKVSIFAPFFNMVQPLNASPSSNKVLPRFPKDLEALTDELIESMSLNFFCTIS